jgi:hypothetical protein
MLWRVVFLELLYLPVCRSAQSLRMPEVLALAAKGFPAR